MAEPKLLTKKLATSSNSLRNVAVVIPAYNVAEHILGVISAIPKEIKNVIVVDDACPQGSGKKVQKQFKKKVKVVFHASNQGVGGAMISGYKEALATTEAQIVVKIDGDGQMDPAQIKRLITPIVNQRADYTKGNRFDSIEDLEQMPRLRLFGNAVLSLFAKVSSGYWNVTDPTNGFTAIHRSVLEKIRLEKVRKSFFFENDMLFRLSLVRAVVQDVPMAAKYGNEKSNLKIWKVIREFPGRYLANFIKRVIYQYYLREWSPASIELPLGLILFLFGAVAGVTNWMDASTAGLPATAGQVMIAALPILIGSQLLLAFVNFDISSSPRNPRHLGD